MDRVLSGFYRVVCTVDDILVTGAGDTEHLKSLPAVIRRLEKIGFKCNLAKITKTQFMSYLGHRVSKNGILSCKDKVETISKAKYPSNLAELISFLGAVQYFCRYIKNMSIIAEPLNKLRRNVVWRFGAKEKAAFDKLRSALSLIRRTRVV